MPHTSRQSDGGETHDVARREHSQEEGHQPKRPQSPVDARAGFRGRGRPRLDGRDGRVTGLVHASSLHRGQPRREKRGSGGFGVLAVAFREFRPLCLWRACVSMSATCAVPAPSQSASLIVSGPASLGRRPVTEFLRRDGSQLLLGGSSATRLVGPNIYWRAMRHASQAETAQARRRRERRSLAVDPLASPRPRGPGYCCRHGRKYVAPTTDRGLTSRCHPVDHPWCAYVALSFADSCRRLCWLPRLCGASSGRVQQHGASGH